MLPILGQPGEHRTWLANELESRKKRLPSYSLRSFAARLGVSPSSLSQVLSGQRPMSVKMVHKVADCLSLDPRERAQLLASVVSDKVRHLGVVADAAEGAQAPTQLEVDTFRVISDWYHFAILSLLETVKPQGTLPWISKRLGLSALVVEQALLRLRRLGFVELKGRSYVRTGLNELRTPRQVPLAELRKWHHQIMEKAGESLDRDPVEMREFGGRTLAIDVKYLPEAKKLLNKFREDLGRLLERGDKKRVYVLVTQLFPLDRE